MIHNMQLHDVIKTKDLCQKSSDDGASRFTKKGNFRGEVEIRDQFGNLLFTKSNTILGAGSLFTLEKLFNVNENLFTNITLNSQLGINAAGIANPTDGPLKNKIICLFGLGTGGAGLTFGDVKIVASRENRLFNIIPIRYVDATNDLTGAELNKYFMRKVIGTKVAYYCKAFESTPTLIQKNTSGTTFIPSESDNALPTQTNNTYISKEGIETYIECSLKIGADDVKEYFQASADGINLARVNELALYFGVRSSSVTDVTSGHRDYMNVQAFSKLTFNSEPLDDLSKILDIKYRIYC